MSYIYICGGGAPHTYSHTHAYYASQTICTGPTLRQAALSLWEEKAMCWLASKALRERGLRENSVTDGVL